MEEFLCGSEQIMENDWRLFNQSAYLQGKHLVKAKFVSIGQLDHTHCAFCWEKFGEDEGCLHGGYCTLEGRHWICEQCFQDFKKQFEWQLEDA